MEWAAVCGGWSPRCFVEMHSIGIGVVVGELCGCELETQLSDVVPHFEFEKKSTVA